MRTKHRHVCQGLADPAWAYSEVSLQSDSDIVTSAGLEAVYIETQIVIDYKHEFDQLSEPSPRKDRAVIVHLNVAGCCNRAWAITKLALYAPLRSAR